MYKKRKEGLLTSPDYIQGPNKIQFESTALIIDDYSVKQSLSEKQRNKRKALITIEK